MALDEALLESVAADPTAAALRTYGWAEPTLSLGYFQPWAGADFDPALAPLPRVRRATGGGAILHDHELTYAIAVPRDHLLARRGVLLYEAVHAAISVAIRTFGVDATPRGPTAPLDPTGRPFLCFRDRDPADLLIAGHKVVGSAQRRRAGAVLQHGSVLLARSPAAPDLLGLADLADAPADPSAWLDPIRSSLPGSLGFRPRVGPLPDRLRARAGELAQLVYRDPTWSHRR